MIRDLEKITYKEVASMGQELSVLIENSKIDKKGSYVALIQGEVQTILAVIIDKYRYTEEELESVIDESLNNIFLYCNNLQNIIERLKKAVSDTFLEKEENGQ